MNRNDDPVNLDRYISLWRRIWWRLALPVMRAAPAAPEQLAPATRAHGQRQDDPPEGHGYPRNDMCLFGIMSMG